MCAGASPATEARVLSPPAPPAREAFAPLEKYFTQLFKMLKEFNPVDKHSVLVFRMQRFAATGNVKVCEKSEEGLW